MGTDFAGNEFGAFGYGVDSATACRDVENTFADRAFVAVHTSGSHSSTKFGKRAPDTVEDTVGFADYRVSNGRCPTRPRKVMNGQFFEQRAPSPTVGEAKFESFDAAVFGLIYVLAVSKYSI